MQTKTDNAPRQPRTPLMASLRKKLRVWCRFLLVNFARGAMTTAGGAMMAAAMVWSRHR